MTFKPDFLGVGAAKAATTSLHDILSQHPQIYLPSAKEIHFFDMDENYNRGKGWYERIAFSGLKDEKICGEFSPSYMFFDHVPERVLESYGDELKFIFIFRNPIDRAYSHHQMHYLRGAEELDFPMAVKAEPQRLRIGNQHDQRRYSYISRGYYSRQVKNFLKLFPIDHMHFVLFEDFVKASDEAVKAVLHFLKVDFMRLRTEMQSNPANRPKSRVVADILFKRTHWKELLKPVLPEKIRRKVKRKLKILNQGPTESNKLDAEIRGEFLLQYYAEEIDELAEITGLNLEIWRK